MKIKKTINAVTAAKLQAARKAVNTLGGDATDLKEALLTLIDQLENAEEEVLLDGLKEAVGEVLKEYGVTEEVADAITKAVDGLEQRIKNTLPASAQVTPQVRNEIAAAILKAHGKEEAIAAANAVAQKHGLVKDEISGLSFNAVVDYVVDWKMEDLNPLFSQFTRTMIEKFFYGEIDIKNAQQIAHQWHADLRDKKQLQELTAHGKEIKTDLIYKIQQIGVKNLIKIEKAGQLSNFLTMISRELDMQIVNSIVMAILVGDTVNDEKDKITTFETIGNKTTSDAFTTVVKDTDADLSAYLTNVGATSAGSVLLASARYTAERLYNPNGKKTVLVLNTRTLSAMSGYKYAAGGDVLFRTKEEIAGQIGVDEIITTDVMPVDGGNTDAPLFIAMIPSEYNYVEDESIDVAYPVWIQNVQNFQKERCAGGGIKGLLSTAVFISTAETNNTNE